MGSAAVTRRTTAAFEPSRSTTGASGDTPWMSEGDAEALLGPSGDDATLQSTTTAYGVGMWYLLNGDADEAERIFRLIHAGRNQWPAFGYIAAEAELAGLGAR